MDKDIERNNPVEIQVDNEKERYQRIDCNHWFRSAQKKKLLREGKVERKRWSENG